MGFFVIQTITLYTYNSPKFGKDWPLVFGITFLWLKFQLCLEFKKKTKVLAMKTNEVKIKVPEGYEIDKENSTFECIKFKPIQSKFSDYDKSYRIEGWSIVDDKTLYRKPQKNGKYTKDTFATKKQAKSALAMAQISQIMANDERFGGAVTDEEWNTDTDKKWTIVRRMNEAIIDSTYFKYCFLAFHTEVQRDLFLKENEDLVKDYLMI